MRGETPIGQTTGKKTLVRKLSNSNGPGQGSSGQPGSAGTGEVRTFPASDRGARRSSCSNEGEPDAYGNPWSRCPEVNSTSEELTEPQDILVMIFGVRSQRSSPEIRGVNDVIRTFPTPPFFRTILAVVVPMISPII